MIDSAKFVNNEKVWKLCYDRHYADVTTYSAMVHGALYYINLTLKRYRGMDHKEARELKSSFRWLRHRLQDPVRGD